MNVLFIRGLTRETRHWRDFPLRLKNKYPEHNIFCIDLPGAGEFHHMTSPTSIEDYVMFLKDQIQKRSIEGKLTLVGISMGGMIALCWAKLFQEEVEKVFAINSSASNLSNPLERFNPKEFKTFFKMLLTKDTYKKEQLVLKLTTNTFTISHAILEEYVQIQKTAPVSKKSAINQLWAASGFSISSPLNVPVTIITGQKDRLVKAKCSHQLASKLKAKLIVHENAGHDLPLDDPDWLLSELRL